MMSGQWLHKCAHIVMSPWDIDSAALWIVILTCICNRSYVVLISMVGARDRVNLVSSRVLF